MNPKIAKVIDNLLAKSQNPLGIRALEKLFNSGIPFNLPHKFKFLEISDKCTRIKLPNIRKNRNHLGGIHACAIATLGEYTAGLTLIKHVGSSKYRLIMSHLEVNYFKQGREDLFGLVEVDLEQLASAEQTLTTEDKVDVPMTCNILNGNEEIIAVVQTNWQLKNWKKVSFKG